MSSAPDFPLKKYVQSKHEVKLSESRPSKKRKNEGKLKNSGQNEKFREI